MRAPKCKICGLEHWGSACHRPGLAVVKAQVEKILTTPPGKRLPKTAIGKPGAAKKPAKKPTKPKAKKS